MDRSRTSNYRIVRNKTINQVLEILERHIGSIIVRRQIAYDLAREVKGNRSVLTLFRKLLENI